MISDGVTIGRSGSFGLSSSPLLLLGDGLFHQANTGCARCCVLRWTDFDMLLDIPSRIMLLRSHKLQTLAKLKELSLDSYASLERSLLG
jgi:hypothetical protein